MWPSTRHLASANELSLGFIYYSMQTGLRQIRAERERETERERGRDWTLDREDLKWRRPHECRADSETCQREARERESPTCTYNVNLKGVLSFCEDSLPLLLAFASAILFLSLVHSPASLLLCLFRYMLQYSCDPPNKGRGLGHCVLGRLEDVIWDGG